MATPADVQALEGLDGYKYGFSDKDVTAVPDAQGAPARCRREDHLPHEGRAGVDARVPPQGAGALHRSGRCRLGAGISTRAEPGRDLLLRAPSRRHRRSRGMTSRNRSRTPSTARASPRPSASSWPASARSTNSEMVYHNIQKHLEDKGVIFLSIEDGLRQHPDLFRQYFGTVIPHTDNKFAALNGAVWSGGSFIYVPQGRQGRPAAAGLLPPEPGQHRPVRAHADHRRRGRPGALRRRLHRADRTRPTHSTAA